LLTSPTTCIELDNHQPQVWNLKKLRHFKYSRSLLITVDKEFFPEFTITSPRRN